jgi:hypothetical protein
MRVVVGGTQSDVDALSVVGLGRCGFAEQLGVAPGIVVGRMQHDGRWPFNKGNELKQRFVFADGDAARCKHC